MANKVVNKNTPQLWDQILFEKDQELLGSPYYKDKINKVFKFLKNKKGKLLDIGFGMGNLEKKIISSGSKINLYGIDFSSKAILRAKKELRGNYFVARADRLPFDKSFFDFVVMLDVFEHISKTDSKKVLSEIVRVIKKDGYFVISVPLNEDLKKMNKEGVNFNAHLRQFTAEKIKKELKLSDLVVFKKDYLYAFKKHYFIKSLFLKLWPNFRKPNVLIVYGKKI